MKNVTLFMMSILFSIFLVNCQKNPGNEVDQKPLNFSRYIFQEPPSLHLYIKSIDSNTGKVILRGGDKRKPEDPFIVEWGDGTRSKGNFPQEHVYPDRSRNYIITVIASYSDSFADSMQTFARFVSPKLNPISIDDNVRVTIPNQKVELGSRLPREGMYKFSESLSYFTDDFFTIMSREMIEYVMSTAATIQLDLVNDDVFMEDNTFRQVLLRDANFPGMYSLWYTTPVSFGVADYGFQGMIQWSSFFHEMGHNFTLNTPGNYYYGGKIDGNANAIFSEAMAQIFQHVTAMCIVNNYKDYGLSEDLAHEIRLSALASFYWLSTSYQKYVESGKNFESWNDPDTSQDETVGTFMTIAYKFLEHAAKGTPDYRNQLKRMMRFLQRFDQDWEKRFDPEHDSKKGAAFRATLMVSALSYAFDEDMRAEFRELNFPVSDEIYSELMAGIN